MNEARFIELALTNGVNREILERLPELGLEDAWLVSGSLFQTVWNGLTGRAPGYGIKDYDIFYFDPDTNGVMGYVTNITFRNLIMNGNAACKIKVPETINVPD